MYPLRVLKLPDRIREFAWLQRGKPQDVLEIAASDLLS
jgi:hypothetical protein